MLSAVLRSAVAAITAALAVVSPAAGAEEVRLIDPARGSDHLAQVGRAAFMQ